jgi:predicted nucleic acid-binding protein
MHHSISYADAFALTTAASLGATLATGDPELIPLGDQVPIEKLERHG